MLDEFSRYFRLAYSALALCLLVASPGESANECNQAGPSGDKTARTEKAAVEIGFYPMNVFDLDLSSRSFKADVYLWMTYCKNLKKDFLEPDRDGVKFPSVERLEGVNGKDLSFDRQEYQLEKHPELNMVWYRLRGTFFHDFKLRNYPFDRHELRAELENPIWPANQLMYRMPEYRNPGSGGKHGVSVDQEKESPTFGEWKVESIRHRIDTHVYNTDWGKPGEHVPNQYSRNIVTITLVRSAAVPFLRMLIPILASAIVASIILFLKFDKASSAIQLCIAMFLSVVAQHHAFLTTMPSGFMLANGFYLLTYLYVATLTIVAATVGVCIEGQSESLAVRRLRRFLPWGYVLLMLLIWSAIVTTNSV